MKLIYFVSVLFVVGCGSDGKDGQDGKNGESIYGKNGKDGKDGVQGVNGKNGEDFVQGLKVTLTKLQNLRPSILDLECFSNGARGTGTKLSDGTILTAFHVMDGCTSMAYYSGSVLVGSGGSYSQENGRDVSKISSITWNTAGKALKGIDIVKKTSVAVGDVTFTVSLPLDLIDDAQIAMGLVTDENLSDASWSWRNSFLTDAAAAAGSSGSPVFDKDGNLFGIHIGGWNTGGLELNIQLLLE